MMISSMNKPPVQAGGVRFGTRYDIKALTKLRDELVKEFPGGPFKHSNGSGIGYVDYPASKKIGIAVYHETDADRDAVVKHLLAQKIITKGKDGIYQYKGANVGFKVIGKIVAQ